MIFTLEISDHDVGFRRKLCDVPAGFSHKTLMVKVYGPCGLSNVHPISNQTSQEEIKCTTAYCLIYML